MENNVNEVVEMMTQVSPETLAEANEKLLEKAIVETASALPAAAQTKPAGNGKTVAIGIGSLFGGIAIGAAVDHWVVPWADKKLKEAKAKRALKKAERKLKKAAKAAAKAQAKAPAQNPAPEAPTTANDGIDPNTINPEIKD